MPESIHWLPVKTGLLAGKHRKAMSSALWLFLWLIEKTTTEEEDDDSGRIGRVLDGAPMDQEDLARQFDTSTRSVREWFQRLAGDNPERIKYIEYRHGRGNRIEGVTILKSNKWRRNSARVQKNTHPDEGETVKANDDEMKLAVEIVRMSQRIISPGPYLPVIRKHVARGLSVKQIADRIAEISEPFVEKGCPARYLDVCLENTEVGDGKSKTDGRDRGRRGSGPRIHRSPSRES